MFNVGLVKLGAHHHRRRQYVPITTDIALFLCILFWCRGMEKIKQIPRQSIHPFVPFQRYCCKTKSSLRFPRIPIFLNPKKIHLPSSIRFVARIFCAFYCEGGFSVTTNGNIAQTDNSNRIPRNGWLVSTIGRGEPFIRTAVPFSALKGTSDSRRMQRTEPI